MTYTNLLNIVPIESRQIVVEFRNIFLVRLCIIMVEKLVYVDFETTGLNPEINKLLTIQWQEIDANTGSELSELHIFKLWDYDNEKQFIEDVIKKSIVDDNGKRKMLFLSWWPAKLGYNLFFEQNFLEKRIEVNGIKTEDVCITGYSVPALDLKTAGVLINGGSFKGAALDDISAKQIGGQDIPVWYQSKDYEKIIEYIKDETIAFVDLYKKLLGYMRGFKI